MMLAADLTVFVLVVLGICKAADLIIAAALHLAVATDRRRARRGNPYDCQALVREATRNGDRP